MVGHGTPKVLTGCGAPKTTAFTDRHAARRPPMTACAGLLDRRDGRALPGATRQRSAIRDQGEKVKSEGASLKVLPGVTSRRYLRPTCSPPAPPLVPCAPTPTAAAAGAARGNHPARVRTAKAPGRRQHDRDHSRRVVMTPTHPKIDTNKPIKSVF